MNTHIVQSYFIAAKTEPHTYKKAMFDLWNKRYGMDFSFLLRRFVIKDKQSF